MFCLAFCFVLESRRTSVSRKVSRQKELMATTPSQFIHNQYIVHNKSIANACVIPRHCKHFHSPIFSNRFIFSVSTLSRAAKPHGAWNKIYVLKRHFIILIKHYKLPINHFPLWSYKILVKVSENFVNL